MSPKFCNQKIKNHSNPWLILLFLFSLSGGCGGGGESGKPGVLGSPSGPAIYSVTLVWDKPETNVDGTPLTDPEGYRIYCGIEPDFYPEKIVRREEVKDNTSSTITYKIDRLASGTYYFVVTAYNFYGCESGPAALYSDTSKNVLCVNIPTQGVPYECF